MLKPLSNRSEQRLYEEIVGTVSGYRAEIYRKVRIADVVDIKALPSRSVGTYALQAHFDVCVCDENQRPQFAIEFDGAAHDHRNDARKDAIAVAANLPMFRVDEALLGRTQRGMTFLQYLIHTWFLSREFHRMRDAGEVSAEEPFVMSGFLKADAKSVFDSDFDFRMPAIGKLNCTMKRWGCSDEPFNQFRMSSLILGRGDSSFIGFAAIPVGRNVASGRARIDIGTPCLGSLEELPFGWSALSDFAEGLMIEDLRQSVEMIAAGAGHATRPYDDVLQEIRDLTIVGYTLLRGMSGPGTPELETAMVSHRP